MRVEWLQLAVEVVEQSAPDLAVLLDVSEADAGWGLIKLLKWGLGRVPQGEYPSLHDLVQGPMAARLIARAAGHDGDPDRYIEAVESLAHPILQRMPDGVRFRGMKRYDVILDGELQRSEKAKKAADARWARVRERGATAAEHAPSNAQASTEHQPGNAPRCLDGDGDGDSDPKEKPPPPRAAAKLVVVGQKKPIAVDDLTPSQLSWWSQIQRGRRNARLLNENNPPPDFPRWCAEIDSCGVAAVQLEHALALYLRDQHFEDRKWPTAVFITPGVWRQRLPYAWEAG